MIVLTAATAARAAPAPAPADAAYLEALLAAADARGLAESAAWQALLHYHPDRFGHGVTSTADGEVFFLAPDGKTNPRTELQATLASFFRGPEETIRDGEHPQCAFRARYRWLTEALQIDPARLPEQPCAQFDEWYAALHPSGVTLIFPEAFMNNPASMFGHTLIRVDSDETGRRTDFLAYTINFAANTGPDEGITFAWRGILGSYAGYFSLYPYYETVAVYGDWESRDIWEYGLEFTADEVRRLLEHYWELRDVAFDYYFFDENCSYQLLDLLRAARPTLRLDARLGTPWIIPADTVRAAVAEPGLVGAVGYRPATFTELRHSIRQLSASSRHLAKDIGEGRVAPDDPRVGALPPEERAAVLGVAYDYVRFAYVTRRKTEAATAGLSRRILVARSQVDVVGQPGPPVPVPAVRPDQGHGTARFAIGGGVRDDRGYVELRLRPAFHDLLDPQGGYTAGAMIDFLDVAGRVYPDDGEVRLQDLTLVDIVSVSPWDRFFHPISWTVSTGVRTRLLLRDTEDPDSPLVDRYMGSVAGGAGLAIDPGSHALAYGFATVTLDAGEGLVPAYATGPGAAAGVFFGPPGDRWRGHLYGDLTGYAIGDTSVASRVGGEARLTLARHLALEAGVSWNRDFDRNWLDASLYCNVYF